MQAFNADQFVELVNSGVLNVDDLLALSASNRQLREIFAQESFLKKVRDYYDAPHFLSLTGVRKYLKMDDEEKIILLATTHEREKLLRLLKEQYWESIEIEYEDWERMGNEDWEPEGIRMRIKILSIAVEHGYQDIVEALFEANMANSKSMVAVAVALDNADLFKEYLQIVAQEQGKEANFVFKKSLSKKSLKELGLKGALKSGIMQAVKNNKTGLAEFLLDNEIIKFKNVSWTVLYEGSVFFLEKGEEYYSRNFGAEEFERALLSRKDEEGLIYILQLAFASGYVEAEGDTKKADLFVLVLTQAVASQNLDFLKRLVDLYRSEKFYLPDNNQIIVMATQSKQKAIAKELFELLKIRWGKIDTLVEGSLRNTTIENIEIAKAFLEEGVEPSEVLTSALANEKISLQELTSLFAKYNLDVNSILKQEVISNGSRQGEKQIFQRLVELGADAQEAMREVVEKRYTPNSGLGILLEMGVDWYETLLYALKKDKKQIVRWLLKNESKRALTKDEQQEISNLLTNMNKEYALFLQDLL